MNFSSHCSQIYCLALQSLPSLLMFTLNSHRTFTFTFWVPCWSGWINFKSFSFPSDQLIKFSRLEDVSCLECLYKSFDVYIEFSSKFPFSLSAFRVGLVESILNHFPSNLISWSNSLDSKMWAVWSAFTKCTGWSTHHINRMLYLKKSLLSSLSSIWFQVNEKNFKTAVRVEF